MWPREFDPSTSEMVIVVTHLTVVRIDKDRFIPLESIEESRVFRAEPLQNRQSVGEAPPHSFRVRINLSPTLFSTRGIAHGMQVITFWSVYCADSSCRAASLDPCEVNRAQHVKRDLLGIQDGQRVRKTLAVNSALVSSSPV